MFVHVNYDPAKRRAKRRRVATILEKLDVLALQEIHGTQHDLGELAKLHPRVVLYGTFCESPSLGGCMIIVAKSLTHPSLSITPQVLAEGRCIRVQLTFPDSELNLICLHVDPAMSLAAKKL